ncbi:zf-HC2 domain-containing protein [Streptomyces hygroscopicus]|uniref:zf-HC2 domain-containing protein n=1 Tax=Streptomyces hygroscopicus TaxID=1912 RepID=UPI0036C26DA8
MVCSRIRTAVSARLDGERLPPGVTAGQLAAHLKGCAACRLWEVRARQLTEYIERLGESDTALGTDVGGRPAQPS